MYSAKRGRRVSLGWWLRAVGIALLFCPSAAPASQVDIDAIRVYKSPEKTRVVFDLDQPVKYNVFTLPDPHRVVIDISSAMLSPEVSNQSYLDALPEAPISAVWSAVKNNGEDVRVVLGLNLEIRTKYFTLEPVLGRGHRLVIDLYENDPPSPRVPVKSQLSLRQKTDVIIAIDAGHGGDDPGAIGPGKLYEKDVVLGIAKKLHALFEREPGFKAKLIREGDYYVGLRN